MSQTVMDKRLMTFKEVMKHYRISRSTLLRLMERGEVLAHKVGNQWRFYEEDVKQGIRPIEFPTEPTEQGEAAHE